MAHTASRKAYIDSGATAHMMKDVPRIAGKAVPTNISTGTARKDTIKARAQSESIVKLSGGDKPVRLNRVLHFSDVEHGLISVPGL